MKKQVNSGIYSGSFFHSRTFIGVMCIAAAILLFLANTFAPTLMNSQVTVVVLKNDIAKGEIITSTDVEEETVFASAVKSVSPLTDSSVAVGKYAAADLYSGDVLSLAKLSSSPTWNDPMLYDLPEGKLAISIAVDSIEQAVADKLVVGDVVSIYAITDSVYQSYESAPEDAAYLYPELRYVKVIGVSDSNGNEQDNAYRLESEDSSRCSTAALTLMVDERQALILAGIQARGHFHIALAARGDKCEEYLSIQEEYLTQQDKAETDVNVTQEQITEVQENG